MASGGMLRGILKNLGATLTANAVAIVTAFVLPYIFLHRYGNKYADWLVLSAAVSYLGNLNFGLQTFVNQDLAVRFGRGEREQYHVQQSTALRLLLGIAIVAALASAVVFVLPVQTLLKVSLTQPAAAATIYFIALQLILSDILFGFFSGNFMVVGLAHRGSHWNNAQRMSNTVLLCALAYLRMPLPVLAGAQFALYAAFMLALLVDMRRTAPEIFPTLRFWNRAAVPEMLKKSGYFGLIVWSTFLCYQLPIILLNRFQGGTAVVVFVLMRQIFGLGRQVLNGMTQSMGPEITRVYGAGEWPALLKLYSLSERIIFALIAVVNLPLFYLSPLLLLLWIHKPGYFVLLPYALVAAVNTVLCVKEHKFQFQFSTNTHERLARVMFGSYMVMSVASLVTIRSFGLSGFLATWLAAEVWQTWSIMGMNTSLFAALPEKLSHQLILRLSGLGVIGLGAGYVLLGHSVHWPYWQQATADAVAIVLLALCAYFAFDISSVSAILIQRLKSRLQPAG